MAGLVDEKRSADEELRAIMEEWRSIIEEPLTGLPEDKDKDLPQKEMPTWKKDLREIKDFLLTHPIHSTSSPVKTVLKAIHDDLHEEVDDQRERLNAKLDRVVKNVAVLKNQCTKLKSFTDPEVVEHMTIRQLYQLIIPTVVARLELAENYEHPPPPPPPPPKPTPTTPTLDEKSPSSRRVSDQVHKLTNDLQYIAILNKQLLDNKENLDKEVVDFQGKVGEIANALVEHSYIDNLDADKLQEKLDILTRLVVKLKQQISSRNQLSRTGPDSNPYTQVGEEIASAQANKILPILHLYRSLPGTPGFKDFREVYDGLECREKMCLLYFALIPENEIVRKRFMTYWWVGEGLIGEGLDGEKGTIEEIGGKVLGKLVEGGCIEPENKEHRSVAGGYKMNPFIRSVVIQLAREAKFCDLGDKGSLSAISPFYNLACLVNGHNLARLVDRFSKKSSNGFSKEISDELSKDIFDELSKKNSDKGSEFPLEKLQTIFNVNEPYPDVFQLEWFSKMKNVKVLYLGSWQTSSKHHVEVESTDFLQGLKNMKLLRFLSLQGMSRIIRLPPSIGDLLNLRILDLRACPNLEELPKEIGKLKRLTHLDLSECYLLERMPKGIASLKRLQVLKGFVVRSMPGRKDGTFWIRPSRKYCTLQDLSALKNLRKLSIYANRQDFPNDEEVKGFHKFKMLQKLTITWGAGDTTKNGGENQNKSPSQSNVATAQSPKSDGHIQKQDEGEKQTTKKGRENEDKGPPRSNAARAPSPKNGGENQKQDESPTQPNAATAPSPKNGGENQKQDESPTQPNAATAPSPKNSGENQKQDESPTQPNAATAPSPKNRGENQKQDESPTQPNAATAPSPKNRGEDQKQDKSPTQPNAATAPGPKNGGHIQKQDKVEKLTKSANTSPKKEEDGEKQDKSGEHQFWGLEKLDLKCYPQRTAPKWLRPKQLPKLEKLYIRGGELHNLNPVQENEKWEVKVLRLKFLRDLRLDWKKLESSFPKLAYLEAFDCPKLTFFPFNESGVLKQMK